jgi:hypothetical protein
MHEQAMRRCSITNSDSLGNSKLVPVTTPIPCTVFNPKRIFSRRLLHICIDLVRYSSRAIDPLSCHYVLLTPVLTLLVPNLSIRCPSRRLSGDPATTPATRRNPVYRSDP